MLLRTIFVFLIVISLDAKSLPEDKQFGLEFNPFAIITIGGSDSYISGTISYFDHKRGIEVAFPIQYCKEMRTINNIRLICTIENFYIKKLKGYIIVDL